LNSQQSSETIDVKVARRSSLNINVNSGGKDLKNRKGIPFSKQYNKMRSMNFNATELNQPITEESPMSYKNGGTDRESEFFSSACDKEKLRSISSPGGEDLIASCRANMLNNFEVNLVTQPTQ